MNKLRFLIHANYWHQYTSTFYKQPPKMPNGFVATYEKFHLSEKLLTTRRARNPNLFCCRCLHMWPAFVLTSSKSLDVLSLAIWSRALRPFYYVNPTPQSTTLKQQSITIIRSRRYFLTFLKPLVITSIELLELGKYLWYFG